MYKKILPAERPMRRPWLKRTLLLARFELVLDSNFLSVLVRNTGGQLSILIQYLKFHSSSDRRATYEIL